MNETCDALYVISEVLVTVFYSHFTLCLMMVRTVCTAFFVIISLFEGLLLQVLTNTTTPTLSDYIVTSVPDACVVYEHVFVQDYQMCSDAEMAAAQERMQAVYDNSTANELLVYLIAMRIVVLLLMATAEFADIDPPQINMSAYVVASMPDHDEVWDDYSKAFAFLYRQPIVDLAELRQLELATAHERGSGDGTCVICIDAPSHVIMLPCRHLCTCALCAERIVGDQCPVCRSAVAERIVAFLA